MTRMRRTAGLLVAGILLGTIMLVGASSAPARPRCTLSGTSGNDRLIDTEGSSVICAKRGDDVVEAGPQADRVLGAAGSDQLDGNEGKDVVKGGPGPDTIVVADGTGGNDRALGGRGQDTCYVDPEDRARSCETKTVVA